MSDEHPTITPGSAEAIARRLAHASFVIDQALQIGLEDRLPGAWVSRIVRALSDLEAAQQLAGQDDRGLENAQAFLHERRQADDRSQIGAGDRRLPRALAAIGKAREALRRTVRP